MNAKQLIAHFDRIGADPEATLKLRGFVLDLAIRGLLVAQDPSDEPACFLLEQLRLSKAMMKGKRRLTDATPVEVDVPPFSVPESWTWTRLGVVGEWGSGSTPSRSDERLYGGENIWLKSGELNDNQELASSGEMITDLALESGPFRRNQPGDVLIAMYGATIGKLAILAVPAVTNQAVCGCTPHSGVRNRYLFTFLLAQRDVFRAASEGGAQPNISKAKIIQFPFPLPPETEQDRIVGKVDELMALCDELDQAQMKRERRRDRLATSSQRRMVEAASDPEAFRTSAGFYLQQLPRLATRPEHISELRRTLLDLAVRGRLVAPEPGDEPVGNLLARLKDDVARRKADGEYADPQRFVEIQTEQLPFSIPSRWGWARLLEIAHVSYGFAFASSQFNSDKRGMPLIRIRDISKDDTEAYFEGDFDDFYVVHESDYLVGMDGDFNLRKWRGADALLNQRVTRIRDWRLSIVPEFSVIPLQMILRHLHSSTSLTTVKHLSAKQMNGIYLPIPPLEEQERIVVRINELMSVCDELEDQLREGSSKRSRLLESSLQEALGSTR